MSNAPPATPPDNSGYAYSRKNVKPAGAKPDPNRVQGKIARPNTSKRSPRAVRIRLRQREVLKLRLQGKGYEAIAKAVGVTKSQAERDLITALADMVHEPAHAVFRMEMTRLDDMLAAHYEAAIGGSVDATYAVLAVMRHRAQLLNWIGTNREPVSARVMFSDSKDRALAVEFILPGQRIVDLEALDNSTTDPIKVPKRIQPRDDDLVLDKASAQPSAWKLTRGSWMD